jgi:choline-sulfatase
MTRHSGDSRTCRRPRALTLFAATLVAAGAFLWRAVDRQWFGLNVVIVTLDTTRADRLSPYGLMDVSMPALDRLAREGVVFDQATSVAPLTLPAHTSLFTGLLPPNTRVHDNADRPLDNRFTTSPRPCTRSTSERARLSVRSCCGRIAASLKDSTSIAGVGSRRDGPGTVEDGARQRRGDEVMTDALRWLDEVGDARFLLWAHLYDAHRPYDPPEPYKSRYADPYVGEIAFADAQIGRVLDALDARDLMNRTIVIVAGDHGESLGDHGEQDHGVFIYESVLRVPLIIRIPSISPKRVASVVRLTDVMPTVLDLLGAPAPTMDGMSLRDLLTGSRRDLDLEAYSESEYPRRLGWSALRALRAGRFKLIDAPRPELYDLDRDPFEQRNVYDERRATAAAMTSRLHALARPHSASGVESYRNAAVPSVGLSDELAALGYVGSRMLPALTASTDLPDPKDCIGLYGPPQTWKESTAAPTSVRCQ